MDQPVYRDLIVLIEPDAAVRAVVRRMVEGLAYRVIEATQIHEGLTAIHAHHPQLAAVLFDLPRSEAALEAGLTALYAVNPGVPLVLTSAGRCLPVGTSPEATGKVSFLAKPYARRDLMAVLRLAAC
ncbi:MAG: hypothetical protein AB4911_00650 [Oscillochloridaceae bacterium umkhey_bin13]